jgi:4-amino-4-deoxy-L-arabinose transferase-like glycosyltransferase
MDDPLFLWAARHIQSNPLDFYGFKVNWYGVESEMFTLNKNPPLVSYYIALITGLFGWSETVIHLFFIIPAISLSLGIYFLARSFCSSPIFVTILAVFSPVFLVSSTSVMSDTMMLAFYVWAIVLWLEGWEKDRLLYLFISVIFIVLSTLTKYFGATLIPLLLVFTIMEKRRLDYRLCILLIPVLIILGYEWLTYNLYSQGLFSDAVAYASNYWISKPSHFLERTLVGLSFTGGCLLGLVFFVPLLWSRRILFSVVPALFVLLISILLSLKTIGDTNLYNEIDTLVIRKEVRWSLVFQLTLFVLAGLHILILAVTDLMRNKSASSCLLFFWLIGTFVFSSYINWTVNARTIYPMLPVATILVIRRMNYLNIDLSTLIHRQVLYPLVPAVLLSFLVAWADASLANSQRSVAHSFDARFEGYPNSVTFQGHWGFQYYMESLGFRAVEFSMVFTEGDIMIMPPNNTNVSPPKLGRFLQSGKAEAQTFPWISVWRRGWAGFYSSGFGPLPFAIGEVPPEKFKVLVAK